MLEWILLIAAAIGLALFVKIIVRTVQRSRGLVRASGAVQTTGGCIVNYYANTRHRQQDNWFQFQYKQVGDIWKIYILRMPSLAGRSGDLHLTHRHTDGRQYWICYDPEPRTLMDAQSITRGWADRELEYITTGTPFERQNW